jgi:DNA adenine methylase
MLVLTYIPNWDILNEIAVLTRHDPWETPMQLDLFSSSRSVPPFSAQLLKWVGNKQRFAHQIVSHFPAEFDTYIEPFLGSGAVLGTLSPARALASDCFGPLIGIWQTLHSAPDEVVRWYTDRWELMAHGDKKVAYETIRASYNSAPNPADLLFICRSCYGGIVRFRQSDGHISTPCGVHAPIAPAAFVRRVEEWRRRTAGATFDRMEYEEAMARARPGDMVYCDPPYSHSQSILYGAHAFSLEKLFCAIARCKSRGVYVALSIDGVKRSGAVKCALPIPHGLFEREMLVSCGRSMLRRFQMQGQTLEGENVSDRLLLTY